MMCKEHAENVEREGEKLSYSSPTSLFRGARNTHAFIQYNNMCAFTVSPYIPQLQTKSRWKSTSEVHSA